MASSNINAVTVTGNLTKDPELRETSNGTPVCELRMACNAAIKRGDEWESKPNYFQVNVWGSMAKNCEKYLNQGSKVGVMGRLEWQKWESKEGGTNSRVVIVANQVEFLDSKEQSQARAKKAQQEMPEDGNVDKEDEDDDDVPF